MKLTRRKLASVIISSAAASTALAQTPSATSDEELKLARERYKANSDLLAKQIVPISTEPALQFKA